MLFPRALLLAAAACSAPSTDSPRDAAGGDRVLDAATGDGAIESRDPADDGDHAVTSTTVTIPGGAGRSLPATVLAPTGTTGLRPLVVISPGFQMDRAQYTTYARHLATWGFVAVLADYSDRSFFPDHARLASDLRAAIDWALGQQTLAIDPDRIAAAGHSLGGRISILAAADDPRIGAVVAWDPVDAANPSAAPERMASVAAAVAVVGETTNSTGGGMPCAPAAENFQQFHAAASSPAIAIDVIGADHMDWVDDPSCGFCGFCSPGTASAEVARRVTRRLDVAWLRRHLFAETAMDGWLAAPPELASGAIAISQK